MAITTLDEMIAGLKPGRAWHKAPVTAEAVGGFHSLFFTAGLPGAGTAPTGLTGTQLSGTLAGQIPIPATVGGDNIHLAKFKGKANGGVGSIAIYDRIWHNGSIVVTTTTAQTVTSGTLGARDVNGSSNGDGVELFIEVSAATTNAGAIANMTASYTDQGGTAGNTATVTSFPATAVAGTIVPFTLAAGDSGVRQVDSLTLGTSLVTGTVHLVLARKIAEIAIPAANIANPDGDFISLGGPRIYDGSVLFLVACATATAVGQMSGEIVFAQN